MRAIRRALGRIKMRAFISGFPQSPVEYISALSPSLSRSLIPPPPPPRAPRSLLSYHLWDSAGGRKGGAEESDRCKRKRENMAERVLMEEGTSGRSLPSPPRAPPPPPHLRRSRRRGSGQCQLCPFNCFRFDFTLKEVDVHCEKQGNSYAKVAESPGSY